MKLPCILPTRLFLSLASLVLVSQLQAKPLKVFILAGQSNMEGQAVVDLTGKDYNGGKGTLAVLLQDPAKAAMLAHLRRADGKWTVRDDVWARYRPVSGAAR